MNGWVALTDAMRTAWTSVSRRPRRIGPREAEQLLSGGPAGADRRALTEVLSALAEPARPAELRGRDAVMAAFVQAASRPEPAGAGRRRGIGRVAARALAVKLSAVGLALALSGTALAAQAGALPEPVQRVVHGWFSGFGVPAPGDSDPITAGRDVDGTDGADPSVASPPGGMPPTGTPLASGSPAARPGSPAGDPPRIEGLCRAYRAHEKNPARPPVDSAAFKRLAAAAGGADNIGAYCAQVLDGDQGTGPGKPAGTAPPGADRGRSQSNSHAGS